MNLEASYNSIIDRNFQKKTKPFTAFLKDGSSVDAIGNFQASPKEFIFDVNQFNGTITEFWLKRLYINILINTGASRLELENFGISQELDTGIAFEYSEQQPVTVNAFENGLIKNFLDFERYGFNKRFTEFGKDGANQQFAIQYYYDFGEETGSYLVFRKIDQGFLKIILNDDFSNRGLINFNFKINGITFNR